MDAKDHSYATLRRAIALLRFQLALLVREDPRRASLCQDLLWCYHEAFALLHRRSVARRAHDPQPGYDRGSTLDTAPDQAENTAE